MSDKTNFVFLHGGGQGSWVWTETIAALELQSGGSVAAIAGDMPGCGAKRGIDTEGLGVEDAAASFIADIENSGLTDVVLVGHSNAGTILPFVAARRPDLVRRYVYVSCVAPPEGWTIMRLLQSKPTHVAGDRRPSGGRLTEMLCSDMSEAETERFMARLGSDHWPTRRLLDEETGWLYDHLAGKPSTYVVCLRDQAHSVEWQETFARRLHCERMVRIDAGHQVMNTRPQALAEALLVEARRAE